jgi:glycosyltransferase involved in cell wall biosynthesis
MRILFVLHALELGGAERQVLRLADYLRRERGDDIEVWGFESPGRMARLCEERAIPWRIVPVRWGKSRLTRFPRAVANFARHLRAAAPEVVLPYMQLPNVLCGLAWRWAGARTCLWNQRDAGIPIPHPRWERWAVRRTPYFVSNSQVAADYLRERFGIDPARMAVVPNGVVLDPARLDRRGWRAKLGLGEDVVMACMLGNLTANKDHPTLLRAWRVVVDRLRPLGREPVLLLAGRLDERAERAKAVAFDQRLWDHVRFLGPVDDVSGLLAAADLGVFSSPKESCPNGVLECMAAGLAVAATNIPGVRDVVGEPGFIHLAPPGDADALADRVARLILDTDLRWAAGAANRKRIDTQFSVDQMGRRTVELIDLALGKRPVAAGGGLP